MLQCRRKPIGMKNELDQCIVVCDKRLFERAWTSEFIFRNMEMKKKF